MLRHLTTALCALLLLATAFPGAARDPYKALDRTLISVAGTVVAVTGPDRFTLSYGDGIVTVEMDDWDHDADAFKVVKGDRVAVTGRVDDDMFQRTTIEASSVYVEDAGTYFFASPADEEDWVVTLEVPAEPSRTWVEGIVSAIDGRNLVIDTGIKRILVDTSTMSYNPLDDKGRQKVRKGYRIRVVGTMNMDFWENRELHARNLIVLSVGSRRAPSS